MKSRSAKVRKNSRASVAITVGEAQDGEPLAPWKKDLFAGAVALAAAGAIVANAAFLQTGQHPAPLFSAKPAAAPSPGQKSIRAVGQELTGPPPSAAKSNPASQVNPVPAEPQKLEPVLLPRPRAESAPQRAPQLAAAGRPDPIGELIAPSSKRVLAVQKALADYGFGQIRPNGTMGSETKEAIEQFERSRKMPVTGQISPRLLRELQALTGRPLD